MKKENEEARASINYEMGLIAQAHGFGVDTTPNCAIKMLRKAASKTNNEYAQDILRICEVSVTQPDKGVTGEIKYLDDGSITFLSDEELNDHDARTMAEEAANMINFNVRIVSKAG